MYLDSGRPKSNYGRYDIMVADPVITLTTRGELTEICGPTGSEISRADPFSLVRDYLGRHQEPRGLAFHGGGRRLFCLRSCARRLERVPKMAEDAEHLPEMRVGIYDWAVVVDHGEKKCWLASHGRAPLTRERWDDLAAMFTRCEAPLEAEFRVTSPVVSNMDEARYTQAFDRILCYIRAGDCYQVNLAQRFSAPGGRGRMDSLQDLAPAEPGSLLSLPQPAGCADFFRLSRAPSGSALAPRRNQAHQGNPTALLQATLSRTGPMPRNCWPARKTVPRIS